MKPEKKTDGMMNTVVICNACIWLCATMHYLFGDGHLLPTFGRVMRAYTSLGTVFLPLLALMAGWKIGHSNPRQSFDRYRVTKNAMIMKCKTR